MEREKTRPLYIKAIRSDFQTVLVGPFLGVFGVFWGEYPERSLMFANEILEDESGFSFVFFGWYSVKDN